MTAEEADAGDHWRAWEKENPDNWPHTGWCITNASCNCAPVRTLLSKGTE